ncbi:hypothetical protein PsorP6_011639 [Peronosclerospora sorghi]|uniref:Uncharacterized protein n=1 Tax=Peronosclerospora sorghi TaxID=230839 RepID=A0ACC0WK11_9STRA|nr:hypothetical protein PsorP6_011639 [Peronosclerospora sorghi]
MRAHKTLTFDEMSVSCCNDIIAEQSVSQEILPILKERREIQLWRMKEIQEEITRDKTLRMANIQVFQAVVSEWRVEKSNPVKCLTR